MVEHFPRHSKVKGSHPAATVGTGSEKMAIRRNQTIEKMSTDI